jgi:toxin ParE1/3/4
MAYRIRWSPRSVDNLERICEYIAKDSQHFATVFAKSIFRVVDGIKEFPNSGRVVPEYNNKDLREKILNNYRIVYRVKDEYIEIVVITHCSKLLDGLNV